MGVIYRIYSPSGKSYIGQTKNSFKKRLKEHMAPKSGCTGLRNAIIKYGKGAMKSEILIEVNNKLLDYYETKFIKMYDSIEPNGYNILSGGSVYVYSEICKKKMSDLRRYRGHGLPLHMVIYNKIAKNGEYAATGYGIVNHPTLQKRYFTSKKLTDEEKYQKALEYLNTNAVQFRD